MTKLSLIIITLITCSTLFSQKWFHTIGVPNVKEESRRVSEHYDKGYFITGLTTSGSNTHGLVIKTDINGNVLWNKVLGTGTDQVLISKTVYDHEGNLYIFGVITQQIEPLWPLVIKLNSCGELQWCRQFYFDEFDFGSFYDAIMLENGDLLALANMDGPGQIDMIFLVCLSPSGEYKWKKSYASKENHPEFDFRLGSRVQFFNDIYIISGYVYSPHPNYPTIVSIRPMFIGIDNLFNELWVVQFGLADNMKGQALTSIPINDSLFMGVGRYRYIGSSGETQDAWAMFYNDQGEQTGYQVITADKLGSGITESVFFEIERVNDIVYFATSGYFYGDDDDVALGEIVFDTAGNVYNYSLREGTAGGNTSIVKTFDNKFTIACSYNYPNSSFDVYLYKVNESLEQDTIYLENYTYDSLCPYQIPSGTIDLIGCTVITNIKDIPWLEDYNEQNSKIKITAIPNPASSEITLTFQNTDQLTNTQLECYNIYGQRVHSEKIWKGQQQIKLDVRGWSKGLYFAVVKSNGKVAGMGRFVRR